MKKLACAVLVVLLIAGCSDNKIPEGATPLPIIGNPFVQDGLKIYELQHGWLVRRDAAAINSFTFVPKPPQKP